MIGDGFQKIDLVIREITCGILIMGLVSIVNAYTFSWIMLSYRKALSISSQRSEHFEIMRFVFYTLRLVVSMILSLSVWVFALTYFHFVDDWLDALLYATSFFTSVGNFNVPMPYGWRMIPSIIAFSGLFSFAWATAATIGMANDLTKHLGRK